MTEERTTITNTESGADKTPKYDANLHPSERPVKKVGYLWGVLAAFLYCTQGPATKVFLMRGFDSYTITALVFVLGTIAINLYLIVTRKWEMYAPIKQNKIVLPAMAVAYFLSYLLYFYSLNYINVGIGSVLFYLSPIIIVSFYMITKIKPVTTANKIAIVVAIFGCTLALNVYTKGSTVGVTLPGVVLGIMASVCGATGNLTNDLKGYGIPPVSLVLYTTSLGAVFAVLVKPAVLGTLFHLSWPYLLAFLALAVMTKVLPAICFYEELKCIGAERASVVSTIETPMTLVVSYLLFHETMMPVQIIGVVIIIASVFLLQQKGQ